MKIGQARLSTIAPVQRCILLEPGGWPRSAKCSSAVPEAQPAGRGKVCKGPRQDVRCLDRDDLAAADSRCLSRFSVPNPECNKIRSKVGERALGGDFITICSAFSHSEARKVSRASSALNRVMVLPAGANFCKACSLIAKSASI
jgi:hypothetical protein